MLFAAIILFFIAALFGFLILTSILSNTPVPKVLVLVHGIVGATGLTVLIAFAALGHTDLLLIASIIVFTMAVIGGLTLFSYDLRKKPIPKNLALLHPATAVTGLLLLIIYIIAYARLPVSH